MKNVKHQNVLMNDAMTEQELDPGTVKATDFTVEGEDLVKKRRALREADAKGKSKLGEPIPTRNRAGGSS
jgi:hypothetical protein